MKDTKLYEVHFADGKIAIYWASSFKNAMRKAERDRHARTSSIRKADPTESYLLLQRRAVEGNF